jgi:hypothetical protein
MLDQIDKQQLVLTIIIMFIDSAIPRIGKGAISDTYVCVVVCIIPTAMPVKILPPRNSRELLEMKATAIPADARTMAIVITSFRPILSCDHPAASDPNIMPAL